MSKQLYVVCEGSSECEFVKQILGPYIGERTAWNLILLPRVIENGRNAKKGIKYSGCLLKYQKAKDDILRCMSEGRPVTTMFDYYALPTDFPGYEEAKKQALDINQVEFLESCIKEDLSACEPKYPKHWLLPYIQLHEFEALFYADLQSLKSLYIEHAEEIDVLQAEVSGMKPEEINNSPETAPSKRLLKHLPYQKGAEVVIPLKSIGIDRLMQECPHFSQWVESILKMEKSMSG